MNTELITKPGRMESILSMLEGVTILVVISLGVLIMGCYIFQDCTNWVVQMGSQVNRVAQNGVVQMWFCVNNFTPAFIYTNVQ